MSQQDKLDRFLDGFTERAGDVVASHRAEAGRLQYQLSLQHNTQILDGILLIYYGRLFRTGEVLITKLEEAEDAEIRFGAQIHYDMPIEKYQIDYFRQAFTELVKHMETGQNGEAELIETDKIIAMRINRSCSIKFREHESAFRKAGANFGAQAYRDSVKLLEYAALPL